MMFRSGFSHYTFVYEIRTLKSSNYNSIRVRVFNTTSNNISVIPWRSVLLMEETGLSKENVSYSEIVPIRTVYILRALYIGRMNDGLVITFE